MALERNGIFGIAYLNQVPPEAAVLVDGVFEQLLRGTAEKQRLGGTGAFEILWNTLEPAMDKRAVDYEIIRRANEGHVVIIGYNRPWLSQPYGFLIQSVARQMNIGLELRGVAEINPKDENNARILAAARKKLITNGWGESY
jgi:hypothetical protein